MNPHNEFLNMVVEERKKRHYLMNAGRNSIIHNAYYHEESLFYYFDNYETELRTIKSLIISLIQGSRA